MKKGVVLNDKQTRLVVTMFSIIVIIILSLFTINHLLSDSNKLNQAIRSNRKKVESNEFEKIQISNKTLVLKSVDELKSFFFQNATQLLSNQDTANPNKNKVETVIKVKSEPVLISRNKLVSSDVRGNLGLPQVVTQESVENWLTDRWQAASDMSGTPIPGEHWLSIDLEEKCQVKKVEIDWEDAFSDKYHIQGRNVDDSEWVNLLDSANADVKSKYKHHIIHSIHASSVNSGEKNKFRFVRLLIHQPSTRWGSSVWRFLVWGIC